ncbi:MAG: Sec-independent protein translocase subunit TatA/TatB [Thermoplasmata archaeon]
MFDSIDDWLIIAVVVAILFYGSSKIPKLAHSLGRATGEFKKGRLEVEKEIRASQVADPTQPKSSPEIAPH